jgi:putative transposase
MPVNNPLERILRELRRRSRVVGAFPDGQSALNLAAARLRYIAGSEWSTKRYLNMELLKDQQMSASPAEPGPAAAQPEPEKCERN